MVQSLKRHSAHALFGVYCFLGFFFFGRVHVINRANQHCLHSGSGVMQ
ncbi:unnamed protein product, partial [Staurois parvus]